MKKSSRDVKPIITASEISDLENKYKGFLPMESARQVLKLIAYARALESGQVTLGKKC